MILRRLNVLLLTSPTDKAVMRTTFKQFLHIFRGTQMLTRIHSYLRIKYLHQSVTFYIPLRSVTQRVPTLDHAGSQDTGPSGLPNYQDLLPSFTTLRPLFTGRLGIITNRHNLGGSNIARRLIHYTTMTFLRRSRRSINRRRPTLPIRPNRLRQLTQFAPSHDLT